MVRWIGKVGSGNAVGLSPSRHHDLPREAAAHIRLGRETHTVMLLLAGALQPFGALQQAPMSRRDLCNAAAAACGLAPGAAIAATITGNTDRYCNTQSTPAATVVTCLGYGLEASTGRLHGCGADEACIASSAVNNPSKYAPPWQPRQGAREATDVPRAWRSLVAAVEDQPGLTIVDRKDEKYYLRAQGKSEVPNDGTDDVEIRMLDETPPRALFRSATRQSIFVYPLQQPVPNQKSHAERLEAIRLRAGWDQIGLSGDSQLEKNMAPQQVQNFFGLRLQGVRIPDDEDYD